MFWVQMYNDVLCICLDVERKFCWCRLWAYWKPLLLPLLSSLMLCTLVTTTWSNQNWKCEFWIFDPWFQLLFFLHAPMLSNFWLYNFDAWMLIDMLWICATMIWDFLLPCGNYFWPPFKIIVLLFGQETHGPDLTLISLILDELFDYINFATSLIFNNNLKFSLTILRLWYEFNVFNTNLNISLIIHKLNNQFDFWHYSNINLSLHEILYYMWDVCLKCCICVSFKLEKTVVLLVRWFVHVYNFDVNIDLRDFHSFHLNWLFVRLTFNFITKIKLIQTFINCRVKI